MTDVDFLKEAMKIANSQPKPYDFGALIVKSGKIIAASEQQVTKTHDPSAHDGISALRIAGKKLGNNRLEGCTMYCSDEPCAMCFCCAIWARVDRVVYARPAKGDFEYEFKDLSLHELACHTSHPIKVEQIDV